MRKRWVGAYCLTILLVLLASHWGSRTVTVLVEKAPLESRNILLIDAGHGGEDGGAVSCTGLAESGYNLEISLRLRDLCHLLGYKTKMIRQSDTAVYTTGQTLAQKKASDLKHRVQIVNAAESAILLSIHQNHFPDSRYSGAQVFYAKTDGSQLLAQTLQEALARGTGSSRQHKASSGVYLMDHITCPGVLIECGFLSNPAEEAKLRDPAYQKRLCAIIAGAVSGYLSNR